MKRTLVHAVFVGVGASALAIFSPASPAHAGCTDEFASSAVGSQYQMPPANVVEIAPDLTVTVNTPEAIDLIFFPVWVGVDMGFNAVGATGAYADCIK